MSHSLNEIEALSKRAGRGAGLSWGLAEEAARAVRWLASHALPSVSLLADVLEQFDKAPRQTLAPTSLEGEWVAASGTLCPIACGTALNDCADRLLTEQPFKMARVAYPLLVVPFAAWASIHISAPVTVSWLNARITSDGFGISVDDPNGELDVTCAASLQCARADHMNLKFNSPTSRGEVTQSALARLGELAHRTYAPATEQSRILGAGAGETDND